MNRSKKIAAIYLVGVLLAFVLLTPIYILEIVASAVLGTIFCMSLVWAFLQFVK